jgi:hypothetical protein
MGKGARRKRNWRDNQQKYKALARAEWHAQLVREREQQPAAKEAATVAAGSSGSSGGVCGCACVAGGDGNGVAAPKLGGSSHQLPTSLVVRPEDDPA